MVSMTQAGWLTIIFGGPPGSAYIKANEYNIIEWI